MINTIKNLDCIYPRTQQIANMHPFQAHIFAKTDDS